MAKIVFKSYNTNDNLLLPPCLGDYLPQNHPARYIFRSMFGQREMLK